MTRLCVTIIYTQRERKVVSFPGIFLWLSTLPWSRLTTCSPHARPGLGLKPPAHWWRGGEVETIHFQVEGERNEEHLLSPTSGPPGHSRGPGGEEVRRRWGGGGGGDGGGTETWTIGNNPWMKLHVLCILDLKMNECFVFKLGNLVNVWIIECTMN